MWRDYKIFPYLVHFNLKSFHNNNISDKIFNWRFASISNQLLSLHHYYYFWEEEERRKGKKKKEEERKKLFKKQ